MEELDLYKFLHNNNIEHHWEGNNELLAWIPFSLLEDFADMLGPSYFDDADEVWFKFDCICLDLVNACDYYGIDPLRILDKKED
jgi:hypothetical protein